MTDANDEYRLIKDVVVEALLRPGNGIFDPRPSQFAELAERVRRILCERDGRPAPGGPQYGERLSHAHAEFVREAFWDLFRSGVINLGMDESNDHYPFFKLSRSGRRMLEEGQPRVHDAASYVRLVEAASPDVDLLVMTYLAEAATAFYSGCLLACAVMLGVAAEAEFERIVSLAVAHPGHGPAFGAVLKQRMILPRMREFRKQMDMLSPVLPRGVREQLDTTYGGIQNLLRVSRNEAGHPTGAPVDRDFAFAQLVLFIPFARQAAATRTFFSA